MLNERDYELLSSYIDGELSASERMALESRLDAEDDLRRELASLRQTVALVNQLPKLKAPRNFTLEKPTAQARPIPFPMTATFSALSAAAAVLLLVFGGYLLAISTNETTSAPAMLLAYGAQHQVAQAPSDPAAAQDSFDTSLASAPEDEQGAANHMQNREALESVTAETPLGDLLPSTIALPTRTESAHDGRGDATADQTAGTAAFFAATAPPSPGEDMAASSAMMQESAELTDAELDDETTSSAADLTQAIPPQPAATAMPMPTTIGQAATVQRAAAPTGSPALTMQPTVAPQQKVPIEIDSDLVGLLSIIAGAMLLIAALATTLARRQRKIA